MPQDQRIGAIDVHNAINKMFDTFKAYHGEDAYLYAYAVCSGMLTGSAFSMSQREIETLLSQINNKTEETMHKLTLETLSAKEPA